MDHLMSLRNTYPPDTAAEFHSSGVDFFSSQGSSFPATSYGQQSSVNPQGGNLSAYSLSADLQHGHSIAQSYQPNMSEGQMASAFMPPNQPQPVSDHYYSFQTPALYQQKHQAATNQLIQNPPSPCHNQTYSVSMHQNQNSQFVSLPGHPQSPQMSPRHFAQHQSPQVMVYDQKSQQIPSSPNQQHQTSVLISGSAQSQRLNQSSKQNVSKQQNNPKDRTCDAQFYSNQVLQRSDSSMNNMHKSQASFYKFGRTAQSAQFFHNGGMNSENKVNGESQLRNIQGSHYGNNMKVQTSNLSKPNVYVSQSSFEHINTSVPSNLQQSRYESILNNSQRMQKASSGKSAVSYMPEVTKNRKYGANFILPDYNSNCPSSSKTPPNKLSPDPLSGAFAYVQNMHYKPRNAHEPLLDNRESEKVISRNASARSARPVPGGSEHLESHANDFLYSNSYALPSIAALMESTKEVSRQNKVNDNTNMRSNKSNSQIPVAHKNTSETLSPVYWFKNPDSSLASSFHSDIEAMQADIDSYAINNRMSKAPVRSSPVSHLAAANRSTESHVSGQSGPAQTVQMSESKKVGNVSRVEQQPNVVSSPVRVRVSKADALAAIQIKQELVESMSRYKSSSPNSTNINSSSIKAASQTSSMKTGAPPTVKDVPVLTNKLPSSGKDQVENIPSQKQLDFNARRHSLLETNKAKQPVSASPNSFAHTTQKPSKTPEYMVETTAASYLRHQSMVDQTIQSGQQFIQTRRNTTPSSLDRSLGSIYSAAYSPDERQNMDRYRSTVGAQTMGSQGPTSQNSIHHLVEQVQSLPVPYPHVQQQHITASNKNKQGDGVNRVDKTRQEQPKLGEETLCVKQPPLSAALSNGTPQQMAPAKNAVIKMEQADVSSKSISVICFVMLHDCKLICLKSTSEKLLLLTQFQVSCFPDGSIQNVNICIDQTLQIKRKLLNHQDTEKVVLFLRKNGLHLGNVLQTITLYDARRVYHYLYGITNCTHASCIAEVFHSEVDHNAEVPSLSASSVGKELKKEKSSDDNNSGQFVPAKPPETNIITRQEHFLNAINHNGTKAASSPTSLPHASKDNLKTNQRAAIEKEVDSDDSDDLILVEASEDPHIIRWSGNAPKVGGICNTIIGQLRSYVHENERFLVVDDLCRVFGTADFYDGVEKENIILYSCCPEIAQFLNAMHKSFSPLQSHHHSLVKEKDIGIHIINSDYTPGSNGFEKEMMGSQTLKRFLCKQEIVDDDCSAPKKIKLGDSAQVLESNKKSSAVVQPLLLNQCQSETSVRDLCSSGLRSAGVTEQQNSNKLVPESEAMNRVVQYTENEASDSSEDTSQSFVANKTPSQVVQCKSNLTNVSNSSKEAGVQNIQDAQVDHVYSCERTDIDGLSNHSLKETAETTLINQSVSQISQHVAREQQSHSVTHAPEITANAPASTAEMSILQPGQSSSTESSRQTDTAGNILSPVLDEHNSNESLTIKGGDNKQKQHESPSLNETACENISDVQSAHNSVLNSHVFNSEVDNQEEGTVDKNNDNSEASVSKQTEDLKFSSLSSFEDLIVSNPTSSIVKKRVEKLKYIFETRKNKNLPLPRLTLDSRLNLHLLTNDSVGSEGKSSDPGTSVTGLAMERSSSRDSSSDCSNTKDESLHISSDTNCVNSLVKPGSHVQGQNNADINFLERPKSPVATKYSKNESPDVEICDQPSVEQQTSVCPQEECSSVDLASQGAVETPFAKYFPKSRRALDDSDVMFSRNIDPLDILPSQCWKEYSKLFQEHRALQGLVGELRKSLAHEKAEKEKLEKVTKYYEGAINEINSTIKYGGENTPVVIDDDCESHCHF